MNFKEAASNYLRDTYDIEGFEFTNLNDGIAKTKEWYNSIKWNE